MLAGLYTYPLVLSNTCQKQSQAAALISTAVGVPTLLASANCADVGGHMQGPIP